MTSQLLGGHREMADVARAEKATLLQGPKSHDERSGPGPESRILPTSSDDDDHWHRWRCLLYVCYFVLPNTGHPASQGKDGLWAARPCQDPFLGLQS